MVANATVTERQQGNSEGVVRCLEEEEVEVWSLRGDEDESANAAAAAAPLPPRRLDLHRHGATAQCSMLAPHAEAGWREGEAEITHRQGLQSAACTRGRTTARAFGLQLRLATSVRVTQERSCQAAWVPPRNGQIRCDTTIRHSADDTSIRWL